MAYETKLTPKDYDRWGKTCVKFNDDTPPKKEKPKKVVKTTKKGK